MRHIRHLGWLSALALAGLSLAATAATPTGPLQLLRITPGSELQKPGNYVMPGQEIVFKFDRDMAPLGQLGNIGHIPIKISPTVPCDWRWLDPSELACRLPGRKRLRPATHYRITVGTGLTALDGSHLAKPVMTEFTSFLPRLNDTYLSKWLSPVTPRLEVRFNLPVTRESVAHALYFDGGKHGIVPVRVTPYTQEREEGPQWLPVPGKPGVIIRILGFGPHKPRGAGKPLSEGRAIWLVAPATALAPATTYRLRVKPGLKTPLGPIPGTAGTPDDEKEITTYGRFTLSGAVCAINKQFASDYIPANPRTPCRPDWVGVEFSAPVPVSTLAALQWRPAVPAAGTRPIRRWRNRPDQWQSGSRIYANNERTRISGLPFTLAPMTRYTVTAPAGVKDVFGRTLQKPVSINFQTGHRAPYVSPLPNFVVLEKAAATAVPVTFTNLDELDFYYRPVFARDLRRGNTARKPHPGKSASILVRAGNEAKQDAIAVAPLGLRQALQGHSGVVWGKLEWSPSTSHTPDEDQTQESRSVMGEVTPWQIVAKTSPFGTLVWVTSFKTGKPVAGARIGLYDSYGKAPAALSRIEGSKVTTDAAGLAVLAVPKTPVSLDSSASYYIVVAKRSDLGVLPISSYGLVLQDPRRRDIEPWAVTEQGVYQPGDTVNYAIFVRQKAQAGLAPASAQAYKLEITSRSGEYKLLGRDDVKPSTFGEISGSVKIPKAAPEGNYSIRLVQKGIGYYQSTAGQFLVTDFSPASFSTHAKLDRSVYHPGDNSIAKVSATLHAGGPYTNAEVKYVAAIVPLPFSPDTPVASGFIFGSNPEDSHNVPLLETRGHLNEQGRDEQSFSLPIKDKIIYGQVVLQASVQSTQGNWIAAKTSKTYAARDRFVGLKSDQWLLTKGEPAKIRYLVVNIHGISQAGSRVTVRLERGVPAPEKKPPNDEGGASDQAPHLKWITEAQCSSVSTTAPGSCRLTPKHAGRYRFMAQITDSHGREQTTRLDAWTTGPGSVAWGKSNQVTLVPDAASYLPGQTAHVMIQNPYPGARALVTVSQNGILWKKVMRLEGSTPVVDVPIKKDYFPQAFLNVTIVKPRTAPAGTGTAGNPALASGEVKLPIGERGPSLAVSVKPEKKTYKTRDTVKVNVRVRTADGKLPPKTRLVVTVVDQGVLDMLRDGASYFDPRTRFYRPRWDSAVDTSSLADALDVQPEPAMLPKVAMPAPPPCNQCTQVNRIVVTGSHIPAYAVMYPGRQIHIRKLFRYSTYWNADLATNARGQASFSFKLPDNLTRWRIFVMAFTSGEAMGVGEASVRVNQKIQLQPALPHQVHVGDNFDAGFAVANRTHKTRRVTTEIAAVGPIAGQTGKRDESEIGAFQRHFSWVDMLALKPGRIHFTASATSGTLGDAIEVSIPVRRAEAESTDAAYGSITNTHASVPIKVSDNVLPGSVKLRVTLSPTLLGNLGPTFEAIRDDPLQTWETRLSRAVLAADYLALKPALPASAAWPNAADVIAATLQDARNFQTPDGGMAFWVPREDFTSPWLSVYTALAFDWLHHDGHAPPLSVEDRLHDYLRKQILAGNSASASGGAAILRAGALAALAPGGHLKPDAAADMLPTLGRLDLFGRALLLKATVALHDEYSARIVARSILSQAEESAGSISFNKTHADAYASLLATPMRANCAALDALSLYAHTEAARQALGDVPAKLVRWITGHRRTNGTWLNSQEDVLCITALAHYSDIYETATKNLDAKISLAHTDTRTASFASRKSPAQTIAITPPAAGQASNLDIFRHGTGRLYYGVSLSYARFSSSLGPTDAGFTVKRNYAVQRGKKWVKLGPNTLLKRGDIVRVTLDVDAPTERHHVVLTDPLPGAFEAVNRKLATSESGLPNRQPDVTTLWFDYGAWPNFTITSGGFYHRETGFDAVRFFAANLPAGHYRLIYAAQVISPGRFIAPAPTVKEIYQPDVFGRGSSQTITVAIPRQSNER